MIVRILEEIDLHLIANHTTKGNHYTDDLYQELYLYLLENKQKVIELYNRGELKPYVYKMAWQSYNGSLGQFFLKYRRRHEFIEIGGKDIILQDVLDNTELTNIERQWLNVYLQHDCNKTWMESRTKICRKAITKHIKEITDKCRKQL